MRPVTIFMPPEWAHHRNADALDVPSLAAVLSADIPAHTKSTNSVPVFGGNDLTMKRSFKQSVAPTV